MAALNGLAKVRFLMLYSGTKRVQHWAIPLVEIWWPNLNRIFSVSAPTVHHGVVRQERVSASAVGASRCIIVDQIARKSIGQQVTKLIATLVRRSSDRDIFRKPP